MQNNIITQAIHGGAGNGKSKKKTIIKLPFLLTSLQVCASISYDAMN